MKITVLGTAAATSMPLAFCNCDVCRRSRLHGGRNIRKRASIVVNDELMVDLGPDSIPACNMYGIDAGNIRYLIQTHPHSDHFDAGHFVTRWSEYAVKDLQRLEIVCSQGTANGMKHWIHENENIDLFEDRWKTNLNYEINIVKHGETISIGDYSITAIDSKHDEAVESLIYVISYKGKNLLYGTDLLELDVRAWEILRRFRLDVVFLDQTYGKGYNAGGHLDAGMVEAYVRRMFDDGILDGESIVFATHISHEGNNLHDIMEAEAAKRGYHIAYDGMRLEC